jgi:hypothetical protein
MVFIASIYLVTSFSTYKLLQFLELPTSSKHAKAASLLWPAIMSAYASSIVYWRFKKFYSNS